MPHLVTFSTARFDPAQETPNQFNPIAGEALLVWLRSGLSAAGYQSTGPETEDWGWYVDVSRGGEKYMVGASGEPEPGLANVCWSIQIHKYRSLKEKLLGRNRMASDDALSALIQQLIRAETDFRDVSVDTVG